MELANGGEKPPTAPPSASEGVSPGCGQQLLLERTDGKNHSTVDALAQIARAVKPAKPAVFGLNLG